MVRSVSRSARTGRFVGPAAVARWPGKMTTERVGEGTGNRRAVNRDAATGEFVTQQRANKDPGGTVTQRV